MLSIEFTLTQLNDGKIYFFSRKEEESEHHQHAILLPSLPLKFEPSSSSSSASSVEAEKGYVSRDERDQEKGRMRRDDRETMMMRYEEYQFLRSVITYSFLGKGAKERGGTGGVVSFFYAYRFWEEKPLGDHVFLHHDQSWERWFSWSTLLYSEMDPVSLFISKVHHILFFFRSTESTSPPDRSHVTKRSYHLLESRGGTATSDPAAKQSLSSSLSIIVFIILLLIIPDDINIISRFHHGIYFELPSDAGSTRVYGRIVRPSCLVRIEWRVGNGSFTQTAEEICLVQLTLWK